MSDKTNEHAFETHVEEALLDASGWQSGTNAGWTHFLPFNRGSRPGEIECGAGNPRHPSGYRTGYFWQDVLQRDSFLDLLGHFLSSIPGSRRSMTARGTAAGHRRKRDLPCYQQLDAVRKIVAAAREEGP